VAAVAVVIAIAAVVIAVVLGHRSTGTTSSAPNSYTTPPSSYADQSSAPTTTTPIDPEADALQQLQQLAAGDRPFVASQLADRWIPQLSSKHATEPWTFDSEEGTEYHSQQTLQEHQRLRQQYGAKLLWSGDWTTYDHPDYWVTVVPVTFSEPSGVLSWCTTNGRDPDHCTAQMVSTTLGPNGTHEH
jgi:eukaryotic-like serine/threonine-protein kinase